MTLADVQRFGVPPNELSDEPAASYRRTLTLSSSPSRTVVDKIGRYVESQCEHHQPRHAVATSCGPIEVGLNSMDRRRLLGSAPGRAEGACIMTLSRRQIMVGAAATVAAAQLLLLVD